MRPHTVAVPLLLAVWLPCEAMAQYAACPGGVCPVPEGSSTVRASVRSRSGPGGGGLLGGLGRLLAGRRGGAGVSSYGAAYGAYGAPQAFGAAYGAPQAPQLFAQAQTFSGGGSCYGSSGGAPMSYSPYSAPPFYSAPPMYATPPPSIYSTPQILLDDEAYSPAAYTPVRVRSSRQRLATRTVIVRPERRPTAVAVRPEKPPEEQLAERNP